VLFADSGSVKTVFQRRYFKPRAVPSAAQALLVVALAYSLNFYIQQAIGKSGLSEGLRNLNAMALTIIVLFAIGPWFAARYTRVNATSTFKLAAPDPRGLLAALCFGCSTWILALRWFEIQQRFLPMDSDVARMLEQQFAWFEKVSPLVLVFFLAVVPALCEELFFRGYALSGLRGGLGKISAVVVVALAFGMTHYSAHRMVSSTTLGLLLGLLVVQYGSIWPAMIAHFMHNAISITAARADGLKPWLMALGYPEASGAPLPDSWVIVATALVGIGVLICLVSPRREPAPTRSHPQP
jgi:membrane protease YdiL (CAAX protease family)